MPVQIHGAASSQQNVTGNLNTFYMYVSAPGAVNTPDNVTGVDIKATGNLADESQKNFELIIQSIGLRAMPVVMNEPQATADLQLIGAPSLVGEGYRWKFSVERDDVFTLFSPDGDDPVGLLVEELNGIVLVNGEVINTSPNGNVEFVRCEDNEN